MRMIMNESWQKVLGETYAQTYYKDLWAKVDAAYGAGTVYPPIEDVYSAFELVGYDQVKVVVLGQDPYHGPGQAHGLSFSVKPGVKIPPSLRNIYKELQADLGIPMADHGYLIPWAEQGVLMFNAVLTVDEGKAGSHKKYGWHTFTDEIIRQLNERKEGIVFVLWGNFAISKKALITNPQHRIIESVHPSPLSASRGFFGSQPFSKINDHLQAMGQTPINWQLPPLDDGQMMLNI